MSAKNPADSAFYLRKVEELIRKSPNFQLTIEEFKKEV